MSVGLSVQGDLFISRVWTRGGEKKLNFYDPLRSLW